MNRLTPETPIPSPSISQDGKLTIPLYHGTGDLFIESIKSTGLGARNMVEELGLRRAAQLLLELSEGFANEENWLMDRHFCKRLAENPTKQRRDGDSGFNYRYGGTYLTPSRQTAIRYALANPLGSEALSNVLSLLKRVIEVEPATAHQPELQPLSVIARRTGAPILIQANGVEIDSLYAEQGGSPEKALLINPRDALRLGDI